MRLCKISEGYRYKIDPQGELSQMSKDTILHQRYNMIRQGGRIYFYDVDDPQDFIHIEPAFKSKRLNIKPNNPKALTSFEGAKIWYGFEVVAPERFESMYNIDFVRLAKLQIIYERIMEVGLPPTRDSKGKLIHVPAKVDTLSDLKKLGNKWELFLKHEDNEVEYVEHYKNIQELVKEIEETNRIRNKQGQGDLTNIDALFNNANIAKAQRQTKLHLDQLQVVFAKIVKDPTSREENFISKKFLGLSAKLFIQSTSNDYGAIFYPQSSSDFNSELARKIADKQSAKNVLISEIPKLLTRDVVYLTDEAELYAKKRQQDILSGEANRFAPVEVTHPDGKVETIEVRDPRWPSAWASKEIRKLKNSINPNNRNDHRTVDIKTISSGDKRRFVQIFDDISEDTAYEIIGKKVLIIDDNIHHQGSVELVHRILSQAEPSSIDIYCPLLIKDY